MIFDFTQKATQNSVMNFVSLFIYLKAAKIFPKGVCPQTSIPHAIMNFCIVFLF
jgi:hypothetical protein